MVSKSCLGAAAVAFVAALVPTGAGAQTPAPRPKIFSAAGVAVGVDYYPDQQGGLTPIAETFHMSFVTGQSSMSSSNGPAAKATVANPGNGVTQGPANACPALPGVEDGAAGGLAGAPPPFNVIGTTLQAAFVQSNKELAPLFAACTNAKWPFGTAADSFTPESRTEGAQQIGQPGDQLYFEGGGAHALANEDGTASTDSTMGGMRIAPVPGSSDTGLPLPPSVPALPGGTPGGAIDTGLFSSGSIQSLTANLFDGSTAVTHIESRLDGVKILGGLVTIDSITSIAETRYNTGSAPAGASSTTVQGVKFLGQDATIDDQGLHTANPAGNDQLTKALSEAGLSIRLIAATQGVDEKGFITAQSQGVVIDFSQPVQTGVALPSPPPNPITQTSPSINGTYFVRYNLASVSARTFARDLTVGGPGGGSVPISPSFSTNPPSVGVAPSGFTGGTVSAPAPAPTQPDGQTAAATPTGFLGLDGGNMKYLYLAFTLATLGMCLAPRLALPARLPGPTRA